MDYATHVKREMDALTVQDYRINTKKEQDAATAGLQAQFKQKQAAGDFERESAHEWMQANLAQARKDVNQRLAGISNQPLYKKHIPDNLRDMEWSASANHLLDQAVNVQIASDQEKRLTDADEMVAGTFAVATPDTPQADLLGNLRTAGTLISSMKGVPRAAQRAMEARLANDATAALAMSLRAGVPLDPSVLTNPLLSPEHKLTLQTLSNAMLPKPQLPSRPDITHSANDIVKEAYANLDTRVLSSPAMDRNVQEMVRIGTTPEAKQRPEIQRQLAIKAINFITTLGMPSFLEYAPGHTGPKAYQRLEATIAMGLNPKQDAEMRAQFGVPDMPQDLWEEARGKIIEAAVKTKALFDTNQANVVFDTGRGAGMAAAVAKEFSQVGIVDRHRLGAYRLTSQQFQEAAGIPPELRNPVPSAIVTSVLGLFAAGDIDNGLKKVFNLSRPDQFGSDALFSMARYLGSGSAVAKMEEGQAPGSMKLRSKELSAAFLIMAHDHAGTELPGGKLGEAPALSQAWPDILKKVFAFDQHSQNHDSAARSAAAFAFDRNVAVDPALLGEIKDLKQLLPDANTTQSLTSFFNTIASTHGRDAADGFRSFAMKFMQEDSYIPAEPGAAQSGRLVGRVARSATNLQRLLSGAMTVVPSGSPESGHGDATIIPTTMNREDAVATPRNSGAANSGDFGAQLSGTLQNILYFDPRRSWVTSTSNELYMASKVALRDLFGPVVSAGADSILPLTTNLKIRALDVAGLVPGLTGSGGESPAQDYFKNPKNRSTYNSVAIAQHGFFKYNKETDSYDLWMNPGRINLAGAPAVSGVGSPQALKYTDGTAVSFKRDAVQKFTDLYRFKRLPAPAVPVFDDMQRKQVDQISAFGLTP
jgi:hypothetical protein